MKWITILWKTKRWWLPFVLYGLGWLLMETSGLK